MFLDLEYGKKLIQRSPEYNANNSDSVQATADLKWLQQALGVPVTGEWDATTEDTLIRFQQNNSNVPVTGTTNNGTWKNLYNQAVTKRRVAWGAGIATIVVIGGIYYANS